MITGYLMKKDLTVKTTHEGKLEVMKALNAITMTSMY